MTKDEYIKMLYDRTEYLKSEIADFEQCNGGVEQARLWAIKEQVSCIFRLIDVCDKELFPDTIRCAKTNEEWLKSLDTEELAKWLHTAIFDDNFANKIADKAYMNMQTRDDYIENWLMEKHE